MRGVTRLLVLGGTAFVGRALVEDGVRRGWEVTTFNRGRGAWSHPDAKRLVGDRLAASEVQRLADGTWDLVVDTWSGAPRAARDAARALTGRCDRYGYVSSGSVYVAPPPRGVTETAPTVVASPDAGDVEYPERKRGSELAIESAFGERALFARAGLILGPHEDVGRLPWWLRRLARGGEVLAPGPPDLPLQCIDARDLARWLLDALAEGRSGAYNAVSRSGHATMGGLLEACRSVTGAVAELVWVDPRFVEEAGIEAWSELPVWLPAHHPFRGIHEMDVEAARAAGLRCRPVEETVADTWAWLSDLDGEPPLRTDLPPPGLDAAKERAALAAWHARA